MQADTQHDTKHEKGQMLVFCHAALQHQWSVETDMHAEPHMPEKSLKWFVNSPLNGKKIATESSVSSVNSLPQHFH